MLGKLKLRAIKYITNIMDTVIYLKSRLIKLLNMHIQRYIETKYVSSKSEEFNKSICLN